MENTAGVPSSAIVLEVLNKRNYKQWSLMVQAYLMSEDLWQVVTTEPLERGSKGFKRWQKKNAKAFHAILISCGSDVFSVINSVTKKATAKDVWADLKEHFDEKTGSSSFFLYKIGSSSLAEDLAMRQSSVDAIDESTTVVPNAIVLEVLNQSNYEKWSLMVQTYLKSEGLWKVVKDDPPKQEASESFEDWEKKNAKALHAILISCGSDVFSNVHINDSKTAKSAWEDLQNKYNAEKADPGCASSKHATIKQDEKAGHDQEEIESFKPYRPFMDSVREGDWDETKKCLRQLNIRDALMARDPREDRNKNTALHAAVMMEHVHIVKELLQLMKQEDVKVKCDDDLQEDVKVPVAGLRQEALEIQNDRGELPLHKMLYKIASGNDSFNHEIVKELVDGMRTEALKIEDKEGYTPLGCFLYWRIYFRGDVSEPESADLQILKCMIEKNKNILAIDISHKHQRIPVVFADDKWGWSELTRYLYDQTPDDALNGPSGAYLICCRLSKKYPDNADWDIVHNTIRRLPEVAFAIDHICRCRCPMMQLLRKDYVFKSGTEFTSWQKWIYNLVEPANMDDSYIGVNIPTNEEDECCQRRNLIRTVKSYYRGLAQYLRRKLGINRMIALKSMHVRIETTTKCAFDAFQRQRIYPLRPRHHEVESMFAAVERGRVEFITIMCNKNPFFLGCKNKKGRDIFGHAIECRQETIYNLMYGFSGFLEIHKTIDKSNNNWLHIAANYSPLPRSNRIQGAYLQMQRELQWFKEVESVVPPEYSDFLNSDGMTPRELFTKTHKKLMEEAENSIKGTATSCTVVGALIITIMFTAAFTVPGGNDDKSGMPKFIDSKLFTVFIASDTISLISSATSVIMFLGILTSRYSEEDYLSSLPQKMMIGLLTLFLSIVTMMIAFSTTLIMMVGGISWIVLSIFLTSVPVATYVKMQLPLFLQTFSFTYGRGIFKKNENWLKKKSEEERDDILV